MSFFTDALLLAESVIEIVGRGDRVREISLRDRFIHQFEIESDRLVR
jgi:hypothetical protein